MQNELFQKEKKFWIIVINSLVYFMLAYLAVIILTNSFSILMANVEGVNGKLYYYGFDVLNDYQQWSSELTILVFLFGTGFSLILGLIFKWLYKRIRRQSNHFKMFYLWGYFLSFTYFYGNIIVGSFFYFGVGVVFDQFSVPIVFKVLIAILTLIALIYLGNSSTRGFLISLNGYQKSIDRSEMGWFVKAQLLYPVLIGNVLILFLKLPNYKHAFMFDTLIWAMMIIPTIAIIIIFPRQPSIRFKHDVDHYKIFLTPLIILIIIALVYRFGLTNGIEF